MITEATTVLAVFDELFPASALQHADDTNTTTMSPWPGILIKVLEMMMKSDGPGSATLRWAYRSSYSAHDPAALLDRSPSVHRPVDQDALL
jgi:hypothetical protein